MIDFGNALSTAIPRDFLLDFEERVRAAGKQAKELTRGLEISDRSRPRVAGQIRTALVEKMLVRAAAAAGFQSSDSGYAAPELYLYQAFAQFNRAIVVRATLSAGNELPSGNKSRKRLVERINARYLPDLFRETPPRAEDPIAVFLVVMPDQSATDGVGAISVCVVDSRYDHYLFNEAFESFLGRYAVPTEASDGLELKLRSVQTYQAPEDGGAGDDAVGKTS